MHMEFQLVRLYDVFIFTFSLLTSFIFFDTFWFLALLPFGRSNWNCVGVLDE